MLSLLQKLIGARKKPLSLTNVCCFGREWPLSIILFLICVSGSPKCAGIQVGVKVPAGFSIEKVATDELATNVYCLTVGSRGEVFVSGPGYIRRLLDLDGDGVFDETKLFAESPSSGAQGMWYGDGVLLCTGDGGLWKYPDQDQDGIADGNPELIMEFTTDGEHTAHAIRKHLDGWFYLLAGNATAIRDEYFDGRFSPIKSPRAGFLMRMSADFKNREIVAHGFRNAYDFDFNSSGETFVYDSDGERDISLPWYRPTRVFRIQPGDDAGWVSEGWKRPSFYFDMPEEIGALGRGSPTGVQCYRASSFPDEFDDAIFVADWTFGRIIVFKRDAKTGRYDRGSEFATAEGVFGFAVTDLAVAKDGSLLVSVGGRGTSGAVYRISADSITKKAEESVPETSLRLSKPFCLRTEWNREQTIEILKTLAEKSPASSLVALESLVGRAGNIPATDEELTRLLVAGVEKNLANFEPQRAKLVYRIANELDPKILRQIHTNGMSVASVLTIDLAFARTDRAMKQLIEDVAKSLAEGRADRSAICRFGQLALGGCGSATAQEMFKGYTAQKPIESAARKNPVADMLANAIQLAVKQGDTEGAMEVGRLAAMLPAQGDRLQKILLDQIGEETAPVNDIHWLNCIAQTGPESSSVAVSKVARALANLDLKLDNADLKTDRNWVPRMRQLTQRLFRRNWSIAKETSVLISGRDGQVYLFDELPNELKDPASRVFASKIRLGWEQTTPNQLRVAASRRSLESIELLRKAAEYDHLKDAAILALALDPHPEDRGLFVDGLLTRNTTLVKYCAIALRRVAEQPDPAEQLAAFKAASQMGWSKEEVEVRDQLIRLLQEQTNQVFGYQFDTHKEQTEMLNRWGDALRGKYNKRFGELFSTETPYKLSKKLGRIDWRLGDVARGKQIYQKLKCALCHDGGSRLGPRLEGVAKRFRREDLFRSIISPSEQIPDRYRATIIETTDGLFYKGTIIYESVDGITLQDVDGTTVRINHVDIESQATSDTSLMPAGLLDQLNSDQWADLYAYLATL